MKVNRKTRSSLERGAALGKVLLTLLAMGIIGGGYAGVRYLINEKRDAEVSNNNWTAEKADFLVTAKLTGTLKSTDAVELKSELEGHSTIQSVIEDGTRVKGNFEYTIKAGDTLESISEEYEKDELNIKRLNEDYELDWENLEPGQQIILPGDLLVELDGLGLKRRINQMEITVQRSENALARQKGNMQTTILDAELKMKMVQNTYQLALQHKEETIKSTISTKISNDKGAITNLLNEVAVAEDKLKWLRELEARNFVSKMSLREEENRLARLRHNIKMDQEQLDAYLKFRQPALLSVADLNIDEARVNIEKTKVSNAANIADANASILTQLKTLKLEYEALEDLREQMANTRIYAPESGIVQYYTPQHWEKREPVNNGAHVSRGHKLIKLPRDNSLMVDLSVPQAMRPQLKRGMKAWVQVDTGSGGKPLPGTLSMISATVDSNRRGHTQKSYFKGEITLDDQVDLPDSVSEGMTVTVEIQIVNLKGENQRIKVPNQCVTSRILSDDKTETGCYVFEEGSGKYAWRPVTIEYSDENFIAIKEEADPNRGLREGELIHLSPLTQADSLADNAITNSPTKKGDTLNLEEGVTNKGSTKLAHPDPEEMPQFVGQPREFELSVDQRRRWEAALTQVKTDLKTATADLHDNKIKRSSLLKKYAEILIAHRSSVAGFLSGEQLKKYDKWVTPQMKKLTDAGVIFPEAPTAKKPSPKPKPTTEKPTEEKPAAPKPATTTGEAEPAKPEPILEAAKAEAPEEFALTAEQQPQWNAARAKLKTDIMGVTDKVASGEVKATELREKFKEVFDAEREAVAKFLSADQLAKYDEWIKVEKRPYSL